MNSSWASSRYPRISHSLRARHHGSAVTLSVGNDEARPAGSAHIVGASAVG